MAEQELLDSSVDLQEGADSESGDTEDDEFIDDRDDEEVEADGAAVLAAEQPEELLDGSGSEDIEDDEPEAGLANSQEQDVELLFRIMTGTVRLDVWLRFYLEFLLKCVLHGPAWRRKVMSGRNLPEQLLTYRSAAKEIERKLLGWRDQGTLSTWVSAHPGLWKAVVKLPYMVQQRCSTHGELQRCAVCYKQREVIKKFLFEGHPVKGSAYWRDDTSGITAPRRGERANSQARNADVWGDQQFGGSDTDTGSSSNGSDRLERTWKARGWEQANRCERYGTSMATRQRRHDRKQLDRAALAIVQREGWAWTGFIPPEFRRDGEADGHDRDSQTSGDQTAANTSSDSGSDSGSSADDAPISQRNWAQKMQPGPCTAAAAGGHRGSRTPSGEPRRGSARRSSQQAKQRMQRWQQQLAQHNADSDAEGIEDEGEQGTPAAAAAGGGSSCGRYHTRGSAAASKESRSSAVKRALALVSSKRSTAKRLCFDDEGGSPAAAAAAAAGPAQEVVNISNTESETDDESLAARQRRHPARALKHKTPQAPAATAATKDRTIAAAADELADDLGDITCVTTKKQERRSSRARCVLFDEDEDNGGQAGAAAAAAAGGDGGGAGRSGVQRTAAGASAGRAGGAAAAAAAAAAAGGGGGGDIDADDADVVFTPGKRFRQLAIIDSDDEADVPAAGQHMRAAAAAAPTGGRLQSPLKKQRFGSTLPSCWQRWQQQQQQQPVHGGGVVDLCGSQPTEDMQDSQQQQQQHKHEQQQQEEEEEEEGEEEGTVEPRPFRRRGFRVGAGVCAARLRLHHLLQHWPHKAALLMRDAYDRAKLRHPAETRDKWIKRAQEKVFDMLHEDAFQGVGGALERLVQLQGNDPSNQQDAQRRLEMYELIETAEKALDQAGRSTFRWQWC